MKTTIAALGLALCIAGAAAAAAGPSLRGATANPAGVDLVTFDGAAGTTFSWKDLNDPVMGGKSSSTWTIDTKVAKSAVWDGEVRVVPSLKAPGFCNAETTTGFGVFAHFNDASPFTHLELVVKSTVPYKGFKVSFSADTLDPQFSSFKADFPAFTQDGTLQTVAIPFKAFSNDWSAYTGEPKKTCAAHPEVCPTAKSLKDISQVGLWTEGVAGKFHLEVVAVRAGFGPKAAADWRFWTVAGAANASRTRVK